MPRHLPTPFPYCGDEQPIRLPNRSWPGSRFPDPRMPPLKAESGRRIARLIRSTTAGGANLRRQCRNFRPPHAPQRSAHGWQEPADPQWDGAVRKRPSRAVILTMGPAVRARAGVRSARSSPSPRQVNAVTPREVPVISPSGRVTLLLRSISWRAVPRGEAPYTPDRPDFLYRKGSRRAVFLASRGTPAGRVCARRKGRYELGMDSEGP